MKNYVTAAAIALACALPNAAHAQGVTPPPVPENIQVEAPNVAFLLGRAVGTQNYVCQPVDSVGRVGWVLFTPQATLFGDFDEQIITHFFSPNPDEGRFVRAAWQDSRDTSTVWAKAIAASSDPNFVKAGAIPWVLLETAGTRPGPTGGAALSRTTFIQRLNTEGGVPRSTDCVRPTDAGKKAFVPYTADYFFYTK